MKKYFFSKLTLFIFAITFVFFMLVPFLYQKFFHVGGMHVGFPVEFYHFTSSPPPVFGVAMMWDMFIMDLIIFYLASVGWTFLMYKIIKSLKD